HAPGKLRNVGRFHANHQTAAALASMVHAFRIHVHSAFVRNCKQARCSRENRAETKRISKEIASVFHDSSSSTIGAGPKCPPEPKRTSDPTKKCKGQSRLSRCLCHRC